MTNIQIEYMKKFNLLITKNFPIRTVPLSELTQSIAKVSNVRVREPSISDYYELGVDAIDEKGIIVIPQTPKEYAPANASAIKSQRLHKGDLIFGYRGKMGKVGLVADEFDTPVVTNNGMIRITFSQERLEETPQYVQTYLSSRLVQTYLNNMLDDRNGKKVLNVATISSLPIPYFEEMGGISKFSTLIYRRKQMSIGVRALIEEAQKLLSQYEDLESESVTLQTLSADELSPINHEDHSRQNALEQITTQLQVIKNTPSKEHILSKDFLSAI